MADNSAAMDTGDGGGASALALRIKAQDPSTAGNTLQILTKILGNLALQPGNPKFKQLKLSNAKINAAVVQVDGAEPLLATAGFKRTADTDAPVLQADGPAGSLAAQARAALKALGDAFPYALSRELRGHDQEVRACKFLPDGRVATGSQDNLVRVFPATGSLCDAPEQCLVGHEGVKGVNGVTKLTMTGDGKLASCGKDGKILVWDAATLAQEQVLQGHGKDSRLTNAQVVASACAGKGDQVITTSWDGTAIAWEVSTKTPSFKLIGHEAAVLDVALHADGRIITASGDRTVRLWNGHKCVQTCEGHKMPVRGVAYVSGHGFVSVDNTGTMILWDAHGGKVSEIQAHASYIFAVECYQRTGEVFTAGDDGCLKSWVVVDGQLVCTAAIGIPGEVYAIDVNQNCGDILLASTDKIARVFSRNPTRLAGGTQLSEFEEISSALRTAALEAHAMVGVDNGGYDHSVPIGVTGGGEKHVRWNQGETPEAVADRFLKENKLSADQAGPLVEFVKEAMLTNTGAKIKTSAKYAKYDYSFPVEMDAGGGKLTIEWNQGENPTHVAERFLMEHRMDQTSLAEIVDFINRAQGTGGGGGGGAAGRPPV